MTSTCLLVAALLMQAEILFEARTTDGASIIGTLVELDHQRVVLETSSGRRELPADVLLYLDAQPASPAKGQKSEAWVNLVDGSLLAAQSYTVQRAVTRIALLGGGTAELPTRNVANVRFQDLDPPRQDQWERILATDAAGDLLVVAKKQTLDYLEGQIHDVTDEVVQFELDGEIHAVQRDRVAGLVYHQSGGGELADVLARMTDTAGSHFAVTAVVLEKGTLELTTAAGLTVARPLASIRKIDFSHGKVIYLSDLEWDTGRSDWIPFVSTAKPLAVVKKFYAPRRDRGFAAPELRLDGRSYAKGLALHSRTYLVYELPAGFRRFEAIAGIDESNVDLGHVHLEIHGDEEELFASDLRGGEPPLKISLEITGVRRLFVLVDFGEDLSVGDTLNLCDARIVK